MSIPSENIIQMWNRADRYCRADLSGEIIQPCLDRTELADLLEKRGFCLSNGANSNLWIRCIVQGEPTGNGVYLGDY
jgi:hypothetical protein